jgi:hypothetical protein
LMRATLSCSSASVFKAIAFPSSIWVFIKLKTPKSKERTGLDRQPSSHFKRSL